ncbi:MAG: hypothetical protein V1728_00025 [Candidatus Micrarchaeota archaeon]
MKYVVSYLKSMAFSLLIMFGLAAFAAAQVVTPPLTTTSPTVGSITSGMSCLCSVVNSLMPAICLLLIMAAGVVYAGGQVAGAETRAKAQGWATAMVIGAVIGLVMSIILPSFIRTVYNITSTTFCASPSGITGCPA